MPHAIFFTKEGHAIHGTDETKKLGRIASHGCVRLAPENAGTLFALVEEKGLGKAPLDHAALAIIRRSAPFSPPPGSDRSYMITIHFR